MPKKFTQELKAIVKREFIEGYVSEKDIRVYPSIEALGKKHGIARPTIYRHAKKEDWQKQKNQFQTRLERKVETSRLNEMVEQSQRLDTRSIEIAQALLVKVGRRIQTSLDDEKKELKPHELRELSTVSLNAQRIGKLALGEAQEISKVSADVSTPDSFREIIAELDKLTEEKSKRAQHTIQ